MTYLERVFPLLGHHARANVKSARDITYKLWKSYPQGKRIIKACGYLELYDLPGAPGGIDGQGESQHLDMMDESAHQSAENAIEDKEED